MGFSDIFSALQREMLRAVRSGGPQSRAGLSQRLGVRPNSVGDAAADLLDRSVFEPVRAADGVGTGLGTGAGRPRVPLRIDPGRRVVLGVALDTAGAQVRPVGLTGRATGAVWRGPRAQAAEAVAAAMSPAVLGVAVALPGLVEADAAAEPNPADPNRTLLSALRAASGGVPVVVDNDGHALAARWWLTRGVTTATDEDVLLIRLGDGALGASVLIGGRPNRGCVIGGNELGHTRLPVDTPPCFCGQTGCLERIASTAFLHRRGASTVRTLVELCSAYPDGDPGDDAAVSTMIDLLGIGVSNAVQLLRPHRVVVVSELSRFEACYAALLDAVRGRLLPALRRAVVFEAWAEPLSSPAESAAHLALAAVYDAAWVRD